MAIGPVQLIVVGFQHREFHGEIISELERLRDCDALRVIGALAVYKGAEGEIAVQHLSNLTENEAIDLGSTAGAPLPPDIVGEEGAGAGAEAGARGVVTLGARGVDTVMDEEAWDVLEAFPNGSEAALVLIEHRWAAPLRDAIARAGGFRISDGFVNPIDLIETGLISAEEAEALLDAIRSASAPTRRRT